MEKNSYLARLERIEGELERMAKDPVSLALNLSHVFRRMLESSNHVRESYAFQAARLQAFSAASQADA